MKWLLGQGDQFEVSSTHAYITLEKVCLLKKQSQHAWGLLFFNTED